MKKHLKARILIGVVSVAILAAAAYVFVPKITGSAGGPSDVIQLNASNYLTQMQDNTGMPMVIEICTPDVCSMQQSAFAAASVKYHNQVIYYEVNYSTDLQVAEQFLSAVDSAESSSGNASGIPTAFPLYIFVTAQGSVGNVYEGLLPAQSLEEFTSEGLNPPASSSTSSSSTSTSTSSSKSSSSTSTGSTAKSSSSSTKTK